MFVFGQGDFTRAMIEKPPTHLYTRTYKFVGLPRIMGMFRRGIYLVTGTAIGVALSPFMQPIPGSEWVLLWVAGRIEETYNDSAVKLLKDHYLNKHNGNVDIAQRDYDDHIVIWDSRKKGRPHLLDLIEEHVRRIDAEVVFLTSNPQGTADIMRGCRERGIPAHGPVWDS